LDKPCLLIISQVLPFPRISGQQQRVYYKLKAIRPNFHTIFLTSAPAHQMAEIRTRLLECSDEAIVLPSIYNKSVATRGFHRMLGGIYTQMTGLKFSNYVMGKLEFTASRLHTVTGKCNVDGVLYEYWHAVESVKFFRAKNIPCILDMHNVLWQSFARQQKSQKTTPKWLKERMVRQYRTREEQAWNVYDALITINAGEHEYVKSKVTDRVRLFYAPMGTDLADWPYLWQPSKPHRIVYYGGLGSPHNQKDAYDCYQKIMPLIWAQVPDAELWLVGSNPPDFIQALPSQDSRVVVTGFVECVQEVLKTMSILLCPWSGTYGFRSRLIEAMALGVPVIASPDAVHGMGMDEEKGIFLGRDFVQMAQISTNLLSNGEALQHQSKLARKQIEEKFSFEATYAVLAADLLAFIQDKQRTTVASEC
jgi:glycosyltransferase involved in cell wall biosynthesis